MRFLRDFRFLALGLMSAALAAPLRGGENVLESVSVQTEGKFTKVILQSSQILKYRVLTQSQSVVLYMLEPTLCRRSPVERTYSDLVDEIRYTYKGDRSPSPGGKGEALDFVTIRLREAATVGVAQEDWILAVELRPVQSGPSAVSYDAPETRARPDGRGATARGRRDLPPTPTLQDLLEVGSANHLPLRIAQDELKLAQSRHVEAMRNLMPSVTGKYTASEGLMIQDPTVPGDDVAFKRREMGVEMGMPLFHSGQNFYALRQAAYQKKVAQQNVNKVRGEITFEIRRAFHNLIKAQRAVKVRRELQERAEKIIEVSRKKKQLGIITHADALGAESLHMQTYYRLLSDEKDVEISRLRLSALLNIAEPLPEALAESKETFTSRTLLELSVPPESLIKMGLTHRPDMLAAEYTAAAQRYAAKAAMSQNLLKVDGTYFTGRAGGAFEDQPLEMRNSWNAGIQASLYFLGSTAKGARTREHTVPDFGETTATNITGNTASVGLLDSLRSRGDSQQAKIARDRAFHERQQARRSVEIDVQEAYYNIQKAKIQIKGAETELEYREKELDIARQKERMNLLEPAQSLQAESSYGDAVANHEEALAFYQVSLAGLERAVGLPLESIPEFR